MTSGSKDFNIYGKMYPCCYQRIVLLQPDSYNVELHYGSLIDLLDMYIGYFKTSDMTHPIIILRNVYSLSLAHREINL